MPTVEYEGQTFEFPEGVSDDEIFSFLDENAHEPYSAPEMPEPLLPQGTADYIKQNEGFRANVYKDSLGVKTIGYGFNIQDANNQAAARKLGVRLNKPLSSKDAETLFKYSITAAEDAVREIDPDYDTRPDSVKKALLDMSYNLGAPRLAEFQDMFDAIKREDYRQASFEINKSLYAIQVPVRARNNAKLLMQGSAELNQRYANQTAQQSYSEGYYEDEEGNPFHVDSTGNITPVRYEQ